MFFTTAAKNKFDQPLETGHGSFGCSSGNVEYYTVKKQTGHILHGTVCCDCGSSVCIFHVYINMWWKFYVRVPGLSHNSEPQFGKRHQLYKLYWNRSPHFCEHKFLYTKLWKGDSYAHFTAVWARVIYRTRSLRSHLKPPSFMVSDSQTMLLLNEWTFQMRFSGSSHLFGRPLDVT